MRDRTFVGLLLAVFGLVLIGLVWMAISFTDSPRATHEPEIEPVSRNQMDTILQRLDTLDARLGGGAAGGAMMPARKTTPGPGEILVFWTDDPVPLDPASLAWNTAVGTAVSLQRQDQAMPMLETMTVPSVEVRALTNGRQIAWRLSWSDDTPSYFLDTDLFCDAAAVQFPLVTNAAYTMGDRGFPVQIMQWKAIWQKDIDEHFQDVQDLHPNYWTDLYWFAEGEFPYPVPDAFTRTESLDWFIAYRAGNPMADMYRTQPVQEMVAEGFGTLTNQPEVASVARGMRTDSGWAVVIVRPLETNDALDYQFKPGARDVVAFAVWEGGVENVGGRKQHSQWTVFEMPK